MREKTVEKTGPWRYALYVPAHPFDGFWDLKWENRGTVKTALVLMGATVATFVTQKRYAGFLVNTNDLNKSNVLVDVFGLLLAFALWTCANWCLTSLMDGKGTYADIVRAAGYALTPYILLNVPLIFISHFIVGGETVFYYGILSVSLLWTAALIFTGTMTTHDYTPSKTIFTIILTFVAMIVMLFLGLLIFSIVQKMINLVYSVFREILLRY